MLTLSGQRPLAGRSYLFPTRTEEKNMEQKVREVSVVRGEF
jgi:hypothetical protein